MENASEFLYGSYIRQGGRILPGGIIRIFSHEVTDDPTDDCGGLCIFSQSPRFFAVIDATRKIVKVVEKKTRKVFRRIPFCDLFCAEVHLELVDEDGWLTTLGIPGMRFYCPIRPDIQQLRLADQGMKPQHLDNSDYVKVSERRFGEHMVRVFLGMHLSGEGRHMVFTVKKGIPVKSRASKPLSYKKWAPTSEYAAFG